MDIKVIMESRKDTFENEIKKYLEEGYIINNSNIIVIPKINSTIKNLPKDYKTIFTEENINQLCFYALLIKK